MSRLYDPLTYRSKHELRELDDDPFGWLEGPENHGPWQRYSLPYLMMVLAWLIGLLVLGTLGLFWLWQWVVG